MTREPIERVELRTPKCARVFGVSPCLAAGEPCYNTFKTCAYKQAYLGTDEFVYRFCKPYAGAIEDIPSIKSISSSPAKINIGGVEGKNESPLGKRETITIALQDCLTTDNNDPYKNQRSGDPLQTGTFWGRFLAREPFFTSGRLIIERSFRGVGAEVRRKEYLLDKIVLANGQVTINAIDPLRGADSDKAKFPAEFRGNITQDIPAGTTTNQQVTFTAFLPDGAPAIYGNKTAAYFRIDDEIFKLVSAAPITPAGNYQITAIKGQLGTKYLDKHDNETAIGQVGAYENARIIDVIYDLLINHAKIDAKYIDFQEWEGEFNKWLNFYRLTAAIEEPTGVDDLLGELCEQCLIFIWYDGEKIRVKGVRPEIETIEIFNDLKNFIKGSFSVKNDPNLRASRIFIYYGRRDPTAKTEEIANYARAELFISGDSEFAYKTPKTKVIYSRWLQNQEQAKLLGKRLLKRYEYNQEFITFKADFKDNHIKTGDVIRAITINNQSTGGGSAIQKYQIISKNESAAGETIDIEAQRFDFADEWQYAIYAHNDALPYFDYNDFNRPRTAFYADNAGKINGKEGFLYV